MRNLLLIIFEYLAVTRTYVHIPKDERKKLDFKSKKCIFLGYGSTSKGYHLYDFTKKKVIFNRDVIFNEQKF